MRIVTAVLVLAGCAQGASSSGEGPVDGAVADADSDSDSDTDPGTDSDTGTGTGTEGGDSDTDTDAAACETDEECDDGLACNGAEECDAGRCEGGRDLDCDDGVDCTRDACVEPGECTSEAADDLCGEGAACDPDSGCFCDDAALAACTAACGDLNDDGDLDISDVAVCQTVVLDGEPDGCCDQPVGDWDDDGDLGMDDCQASFDWMFRGAPGCREAE